MSQWPTHRDISLLLHSWLKWSRPFDECPPEVRADFNKAASDDIARLNAAAPEHLVGKDENTK